jgi:hypothetical protein
MLKNPRPWVALALAASWCGPALAQTVYRCGDSYGQQPCPGGRAVDTEDSRTPAQRAQTTEAVRRDAKAADELEKARLKEEAKVAPAMIPAAKVEAPQDTRDRTDSQSRPKKPAHFTAVAPKKPGAATAAKKKKKTKKPAA